MLNIAKPEQPSQAKPGTIKFSYLPFVVLSICILFIFVLFCICIFIHAFFHILPSFTCSDTGMYGGNLDLVSRRENVQVILEESWSSNTTTHSHKDIA